ncbi:hypothetical protein Tco_0786244 [Tanacetum coccineum]
MAYRLELPEKLSSIHNTFHISNLKKCLSDESLVIPMKELQLDDKLNFVEEPVEVMDREIKQLKRSRIPIIKVRWNSKRGPEFTWEREDEIRAKYPHLFSIITSSSIKSRDEISVARDEAVTIHFIYIAINFPITVQRIFRYLKGQPKLGLWFPRDSPFDLDSFSDSDYAGTSLDRKSTTGEFDIEIKDKKGKENVAVDHLSRIDNDETSDDSDVDDNFTGETLMEITTNDTP